MIRLAIALAALAAAAYGGYFAYEQLHPAPAPVPVAKAGVRDAAQLCLDLCEQNRIVAGADPEAGKACRARCGIEAGRRPNEPIRSITRAPADHSARP